MARTRTKVAENEIVAEVRFVHKVIVGIDAMECRIELTVPLDDDNLALLDKFFEGRKHVKLS